MKIAAITDDGKTISRHFGRARYYLVCTVEDGRITGQELRDKAGHHSFAAQEDHRPGGSAVRGFDVAAQAKHAQMLAVIDDCQTVLAGGMGQGMLLNMRQAGIRPVLTDEQEIEAAVQAFIEGCLVERPDSVCH